MQIDPNDRRNFKRSNVTFDSGLLQALARDNVDLCDGKGDFEAITSAVMAAFAFEAFINEIGQLSRTLANPKHPDGSDVSTPIDPLSVKLATVLLEADDKSTLERFDLIWETITGQSINLGRDPRQSLQTVFSIRNELAHLKSQQTEIFPEFDQAEESFDLINAGHIVEVYPQPKFMRSLESRHLLNPESDPRGQWTLRISSGAFAKWICDVVERSAQELVAQLPVESALRIRLTRNSLAGFSNERRLRRWARQKPCSKM